jgi:Na+-driven multidrug efflux pump
MVMWQAFNGAGDTNTPTMLNLLCFWAFQIPLAWLLAFRAGLGTRGLFMAIPIAQSALAVAGVLLFRRGKWKGSTV